MIEVHGGPAARRSRRAGPPDEFAENKPLIVTCLGFWTLSQELVGVDRGDMILRVAREWVLVVTSAAEAGRRSRWWRCHRRRGSVPVSQDPQNAELLH